MLGLRITDGDKNLAIHVKMTLDRLGFSRGDHDFDPHCWSFLEMLPETKDPETKIKL